MKIRSVVLGGAGAKCIGFLGCLHKLIEQKIIDMKYINTLIGVSSGSMVSYLLCIGYTPYEILRYILNNDMFIKLNSTCNITMMFSRGIFDYEVIEDALRELTYKKTGKYTLSFGDIRHIYNKRLVICSYNETCQKTVYFDSHNTQNDDDDCLSVIRCSSNIPYIFGDYTYKDCEYIDGGFSDILPIHFVDNQIYYALVLSSNIYSLPSKLHSEKLHSEKFTAINKLLNRLQIPTYTLMKRRLEYASKKIRHINIELEEFPIYDFNMSFSKVLDMFESGMKCASTAPFEWENDHLKTE